MRFSLLFLIVGLVCCQTDEEWKQYKTTFNKIYPTAEDELFRKGIWTNRVILINQNNNDANAPYKMSQNALTDRTDEELNSKMCNYVGLTTYRYDPTIEKPTQSTGQPSVNAATLPTSVDWRNTGAVTEIKNQQSCGSCWAFTSIAWLESFLAIKTLVSYNLSEEYLVECTSQSDCTGGYVSRAIRLAMQYGIPRETEFPYVAYQYSVARPTTLSCSASTTLDDTVKIPTISDVIIRYGVTHDQLRQLLTVSPVPTLIKASGAFYSYQSGIYSCTASTTSELNHAILVVGYDQSGNYIIKNSWGTNWGISGYMIVNQSQDCGIKMVVYEIPSTVVSKITYTTVNATLSIDSGIYTNPSLRQTKFSAMIGYLFCLFALVIL